MHTNLTLMGVLELVWHECALVVPRSGNYMQDNYAS